MASSAAVRVTSKLVYDLDEPCEEGRALLGGKGAGLAEMTALGVPVPAGFTITTDACRAFMAAGGELPDGLEREVASTSSGWSGRQASASAIRSTRCCSRFARGRRSRCRG